MVAVMTDGLDRRAFNRLAPELRITHIRCEAWGRWSKEKLSPWPDRTILGRLIEQGPSAGEPYKTIAAAYGVVPSTVCNYAWNNGHARSGPARTTVPA